jgi:pyruvate carboxylase subunit B
MTKDPNKGVAAATANAQRRGPGGTSDENIFIAAACKDKGIAYLKGQATLGVRKKTPESSSAEQAGDGSGSYRVSVDGREYRVEIGTDGSATVDSRRYDVSVDSGSGSSAGTSPGTAGSAPAGGEIGRIDAPLPGKIIRISCAAGDRVHKGETVLVIEAMKMETELKSPVDGIILRIAAEAGQQVNTGDLLASIGN